MTTGPAGDNRDDLEAIRLAKARLVRVCRLTGQAAEEALARAAADQRTVLVAVAMRVLAASPEDLAAGRVVEVGRPIPQRRREGPRYPKRTPPQQRWQGKSRKRPRR